MDGMQVVRHEFEAPAADYGVSLSHTVNLAAPTAVIAEISVSSFDNLYTSGQETAYGVFTACRTDGSNPPLPPEETFDYVSISGAPSQSLVRNGLMSLSYSLEVENCDAAFTVNLFFWPAVQRF